MYWPIMTDYQEAVQSPKICFADNELREGRLDLDRLGLPRPISGNFASVYGLTYRTSKWAVRCFLQNTRDQEKRYQYINTCLEKARSPYFVPFRYIHDGIKIKGVWYPILKMEWINGESLSTYIERNLANPSALHSLSQKFIGLAKSLEENSIAHGDLQHGNILIVGNEIKLVDYDGMYVPGLDGMASNENGHPNYQHPMRSEKDFGPHLDRFSEWVIYLSLKAIARDPSLWTTLKGGDENLIFRKADFLNPSSADSFRLLESRPDPEQRKIAHILREIIACPDLPHIPSLDGQALSAFDRQSAPAPRPENKVTSPAHPAWILDYVDFGRFEFFEDMNLERRSLTVLGLAFLATLAFFAFQEINSAIFLFFLVAEPALSAAFIYLRYQGNAKVQQKQDLLARRRANRAELARLEREIADIRARIVELTTEEKGVLSALNQRVNHVAQVERDEIALVDLEIGQKVAGIQDEIRQLNLAEAEDFKKSLAAYQEEFVATSLGDFRLADAALPGFGEEIKKRLADAGIATAADFVDYQTEPAADREIAFLVRPENGRVHVAGVGPAKAKALLAWRADLEQQQKSRLPKILPPEEAAHIKANYGWRRDLLADKILDTGPEAERRKSKVHSRYRPTHQQNRDKARRYNRTYAGKRDEQEEILAALRTERNRLDREQDALNQQLSAYQKINLFYFLKRVLQF